MKIVVMWEDPSEEEAARNLTEVLPRIAPSLANAAIDANGGVSVRYNASQPLRVRARCCPDSDDLGIRELREEAQRIVRDLAAQSQIPPAVVTFGDPLRAEGSTPYTLEGVNTIKRAWSGQVVAGGQLPRDWSRCPRCGVPKFDGAQHTCDPDKAQEYQSRLPRSRPVPPQPKPPSETRDLIFPDEDE